MIKNKLRDLFYNILQLEHALSTTDISFFISL